MKNLKLILLLAFVLTSISAYADWKPEFIKSGISKNEQSKLNKDYKLAHKDFQEKSGKFLDFYVDLKLGGTSTSASVTQQNGIGAYNTGSKAGFNIGALFFVRVFDSFQFSSGLDYNGKNFEVTSPIDTTTANSLPTGAQKISNNYLNIPMNFNFGGMITDKVGLTFNGGPYLGILLSTDEKSGLGYKNFDLGLNGTLTANYKIAPLTSVILGAKYEYGGLNNLGSTRYVDKVSTSSLGFFTGVRFAID
ncbi:MAG: outer membrane beta-barrel protein [Bacteroidetes bacterium]|nr:outer membrane beta-barrel protein [Bacteroidota bacterium]MBX7046554.1 outer membrane beta-barrel protein [Ignavibacteria bacterium]